jgi:hypothetical protein
MNTHIDAARTLTDDALLDGARSLAARARGATAELIAHLAEVETRNLHVRCGYGSMFTYCCGALRLSESEAYSRIEAARAARRFPVILNHLTTGAVTLTAVKILAPHLTDENHVEALESARGQSKAEVEKIVARLSPAPDAPVTIRKVPAPRGTAAASPSSTPAVAPQEPSAGLFAVLPSPAEPPPPTGAPSTPTVPIVRAETPRAQVNALSPDRYKLQLTIDGDTLEMLRLAQDMSRHTNPSGEESQIIKAAVTLLVHHLAKSKFAATDNPRPSTGVAADSRHVPAEVKREVYVRDRGRCAFVGKDGHRCEERGFIEFHHVRPYAEGGLATVDNIALRCQRHNAHEWELRSTEVRRIEEEWHRRQFAAVGARSRPRTRSGRSAKPGDVPAGTTLPPSSP